MHNQLKISIATITCISIAACNTTQTTETNTGDANPDSVPMAKLVAPTPLPELETPNSEPLPLAIGDNAPAISIDHWVKGEDFDTFEDGQVYVMEFWATWCGPCITTMPHLSGLQAEYGDAVKFTGVSSEPKLQTVVEFFTKTNSSDGKLNSDRMAYTVAVDPDRSTSTAYMKAAGQNGIPTAFIVDGNGKVAWIGHPMSMDGPLAEIVDGTWDLASAAEEFKTEQKRDLAMRNFRMSLRTTQEDGDWDAYIGAIDAFVAEFGDDAQLDNMKFDALLKGKKDNAAAYAWADTMMHNDWDNSSAMNAMAWNIVDRMPANEQDLDFALKIALRGCELTTYEDPMILDTLARCYWELGQKYKAIEWQKKAVSLVDDSSMSASMTATLNEYNGSLANVDQ
jgi:thiol-disulfide isomerase/thioredoxin